MSIIERLRILSYSDNLSDDERQVIYDAIKALGGDI